MALSNVSKKLLLSVVPPLYSLVTKTLFACCRVTKHGQENYQQVLDTNTNFIASFWHYSLFYIMHLANIHEMVAMVSASDDAEYVAQFLNRLGVETVRGSRNRGGMRALKNMVSIINEKGKSGAIVADGSQGPPLEAQAGAILLAAKTGIPILPVAWSASNYWAFNSWDRTVLPKPFSRISLYYGKPLIVPSGIKAKDIEPYRLDLEQRMNDIYQKAWSDFGVEKH